MENQIEHDMASLVLQGYICTHLCALGLRVWGNYNLCITATWSQPETHSGTSGCLSLGYQYSFHLVFIILNLHVGFRVESHALRIQGRK